MSSPLQIGVLALQGDYLAHSKVLTELGAEPIELRTAEDFNRQLDGLVIPGGESTVMRLGIEREGLAAPIATAVKAGTPVFGTCAGLVMLSREYLNLLDVSCERNAFGRQLQSFETDLKVDGFSGDDYHAVFIRAPVIKEWGEGVSVLAKVDGKAVAVKQEKILATAFHPELTDDNRLHSEFLSLCREL